MEEIVISSALIPIAQDDKEQHKDLMLYTLTIHNDVALPLLNCKSINGEKLHDMVPLCLNQPFKSCAWQSLFV